MHKFGMQYLLLLLVESMEPLVTWVRLVLGTHIFFNQDPLFCKLFYDYFLLFNFKIRTLGMLRSRFDSVPSAFYERLVPMQKEEHKRDPLVRKKNIIYFSFLF